MKFSERNKELLKVVDKFAEIHDKYTNSNRILTDEEWNTYINEMDFLNKNFKSTNMATFAGGVSMAFLDDTTFIQKKLKELKDAT